ncbi:MAG: hypothetical protein ACREDI_12810, partial [Roseiarcus sp.]
LCDAWSPVGRNPSLSFGARLFDQRAFAGRFAKLAIVGCEAAALNALQSELDRVSDQPDSRDREAPGGESAIDVIPASRVMITAEAEHDRIPTQPAA